MSPALDQLCIDTLRMLGVDMVEKARSGHPGLPLGAAPMAYVLWSRFLRHNPTNPAWWDRDRFVLSAGHGSALLYALLYLTGYPELTLDQIKRFRQWGSVTPGHPESHLTRGVEASTGPLGQGMGNALGMAIAEAHLAARYNRPGHEIFHHTTYVLASDGDMMEGVASEAGSLAGHLRLGRLIVLHDDNGVTLSATTSITFTEDVTARYAAYGWHVQRVRDGNDTEAIARAITAARDVTDRPSLIAVRTVLGCGAPDKQGTFQAHGSPLGPEEVARTKEHFGWPLEPTFFVPDAALSHYRRAVERGAQAEEEWRARFRAYESAFPDLAVELVRRFDARLPEGWDEGLPSFPASPEGMATRKASEGVLQSIADAVPELVGGSGDLDSSTYTWIKGRGDFESKERSSRGVQGTVGGGWGHAGRNIHFGVREHAMGTSVNGLVYHGGFIPFGATFLVFHDYMRPAVRLSAIAGLRSIWVYTHDSIGVGEDGPTHEPVEQLAALRAMPNLVDIRPCDANETRWAWQVALEAHDRPTAIVLTRQSVPTLDRSVFAPASMLRHGAYVLDRGASAGDPEVILIASGSEVALIVEAAELLKNAGIRARLVSMPSWRLFEEQSAEYREGVLPARIRARLAVEAASPLGWERWVGLEGAIMSVNRFGASAPGPEVLEEYGFTAQRVADAAAALRSRARAG
ncbi:transketolase [Sorangium sp. So ce1151]|uniref:transketolase n=1 Tax=Sorangium sp. So ce1151 TaxID=3133332 RepID=UPI003F612F12